MMTLPDDIDAYYRDDEAGIRLYLADNKDVLPHLSGVDLVFTSPPYNMGNTTGGGFPGKKLLGHYDPAAGMQARNGGMGKWSGGTLVKGYDEHDDNMPHDEYVAWQKAFLLASWATLSDTGAIYYNHKPRILSGRAVLPLDHNPDLPLRQIIIWARAGGINFSGVFYCPTHEWIMILAKEGFRLRSKAASGAGDVWYIPQEENANHPAPFPVELPRRAIETTAPGLVLDPFCGICSTIVAAKRQGVPAIGIDTSQEYLDYGIDWLKKTRRTKRLPFPEPEPVPEQLGLGL
jgi:site-specific DNA-methyltransferase (adenine-specific)